MTKSILQIARTLTTLVGDEYFEGQDADGSFRSTLDVMLAALGLGVSRVHATAAQLRNAFSVPIDLVPAQGAGKIIVPMFFIPRYTAGSYNFNAASFPSYLVKMGSQQSVQLIDFTAMLQNLSLSGGLAIASTALAAWNGYIEPWTGQNVPLQLTSEANMVGGAVATVSVGDSGGAGYAPGDIVFVAATGNATYIVDTVDGGGAVTGLSISVNGVEDAGTNLPADGNGAGTGLTLDVTVNPGDGSVDFTTLYMAV